MRKIVAALLVFVIVVLVAWWALREAPTLESLAETRAAEHASASDTELTDVEAPTPSETAQRAPASAVTADQTSIALEIAPEDVLTVRGRVVDPERKPFENADVSLCVRAGDVLHTSSARDGTFRFVIDRSRAQGPGRSHVYARAGDDYAGFRLASLPDVSATRGNTASFRDPFAVETKLDEVDAGTVVLLPATRVHVKLRARGEPAARAELTATLDLSLELAQRFVTDDHGELFLPPFPAGRVHLRGELGAFGAARVVYLPDEHDVVLDLVPARELEFLVVDGPSNAPVAGAALQFNESVRLTGSLDPENPFSRSVGEYWSERKHAELATTTDADGRARVRLPPDAQLRVTITEAGHEPYPGPRGGAPALDKAQSPLRIVLQPLAARTVRWPIEAGELPVPDDGTALTLTVAPGWSDFRREEPPPPEGRVEAGHVVVDGLTRNVGFLARTADGSLTSLYVPRDGEAATVVSFRRPRTIDVSVRDDSGAPLAGARVIARNEGNNELSPWVATDAEGRASITGLFGERAIVQVRANAETPGVSAGSVDIRTGDGHLEVTVSTAMLRVRARMLIDGVPRLPPKFGFSADGVVRVLEELPDAGEVVLRCKRPSTGDTLKLSLAALGYARATADVALTPDAELVAVFALERAARMFVELRGAGEERVSVGVRQWSAETNDWRTLPGSSQGLSAPNGPGGTFLFEGLAPGRYRASASELSVVSDPVELGGNALEARVVLDASGSGWVTGRIECAAESDLVHARVVVDGVEQAAEFRGGPPRLNAKLPGASLAKGGTFRVRVPGDRDVTFRAWHPWLTPAHDGGAITLRKPQDGVVLRLETGPVVNLPLTSAGAPATTRTLRIAAYHGAVTGAPLATYTAVVEAGNAKFGGLEPGTWTLWIDPTEEHAPFTLADVEVKAGETTLPTVALTNGSMVRVRVLSPPGGTTPRMYVNVRRAGGPEFTRQINSRGEAEIVLGGFDRARYTVQSRTSSDWSKSQTVEVELDGVHDAIVDYDAR
jgi:hypothetical protein